MTGSGLSASDPSLLSLLSLLYSSTAVEPFDDAQLHDLLEQSRESNARHAITGMLLYRAGRFFQVLEGPEPEVRALAERISRDPRHSGMRVLFDEPVAERGFAEWTMGFEPIAVTSGPPAPGFRDTFADLEGADRSASVRAAREMSMWFRVRSAGSA